MNTNIEYHLIFEVTFFYSSHGNATQESKLHQCFEEYFASFQYVAKMLVKMCKQCVQYTCLLKVTILIPCCQFIVVGYIPSTALGSWVCFLSERICSIFNRSIQHAYRIALHFTGYPFLNVTFPPLASFPFTVFNIRLFSPRRWLDPLDNIIYFSLKVLRLVVVHFYAFCGYRI